MTCTAALPSHWDDLESEGCHGGNGQLELIFPFVICFMLTGLPGGRPALWPLLEIRTLCADAGTRLPPEHPGHRPPAPGARVVAARLRQRPPVDVR